MEDLADDFEYVLRLLSRPKQAQNYSIITQHPCLIFKLMFLSL